MYNIGNIVRSQTGWFGTIVEKDVENARYRIKWFAFPRMYYFWYGGEGIVCVKYTNKILAHGVMQALQIR